ncbi:MAG: carboxypeptidase regulatory-like domain-containing protein, partial [Candidatus Sulfotelmatobacter sp.]
MKYIAIRLSALVVLLILAAPGWSQSLISGDLAGAVYDTSGAAVPNVSLALKNTDSGETFSATSNSAGAYRFALLKPGHYELTATASGFNTQLQKTIVQVGQQTTLNINLPVKNSNSTVEVNAQEESLLETDHADISTAFDEQQVQYVPNPGNDLTYVAQVAPGALMNTEQGTGNFNVFGLPGSSNVFTVDGGFEDTYGINTNYSAASNLLLGNNDIAEVTVVSPAYQGQYGSSSGAFVTELTKSGGSTYHGNAVYWWNGRVLNANNYFNKQNAPITLRPFDNANQWAASVGGPVPHTSDKLHFFFDNEGIRLVLPTSSFVYIPSKAFQQAVLGNISQVSPAQLNFYQNLFKVYNGAQGAAQAGTVSGSDPSGCNNQSPVIQGVPFGAGAEPCSVQFRSVAGNSTNETIYVGRVDYDANSKDHLFAHFKIDKGLQASYTDPINPLFNVTSKQPEYEAQLNESHIFTPNLVNQFVMATMYYRGNSGNPNLAASTALFPYTLSFASGTFASLGGQNNQYPAGRNVTQYQLIDDLSWSKGRHTVKIGASFRRANMTNYSPGSGTIGYSSSETLNDFINGVNDVWTQSFPLRQTQPVSLWALGMYAQDEWAVLPNVKITLSLRSDTESNPVCHTNCYARFASDFLS